MNFNRLCGSTKTNCFSSAVWFDIYTVTIAANTRRCDDVLANIETSNANLQS